MIRIAADGGVGLWLHGHIHKPFVLSSREAAPFPIIWQAARRRRGNGTTTSM